ncbi:MAG: hypothetical protein HYZ73_09545, partial [Elusimicrobia bacterium]|nr:hypothetical protein [Elusimicrobiota bacterium]
MPPGTEPTKTVILMQDAHGNPEAQRNLGKALQVLIDQQAIGLVALEGAFDPIDLTPFRTFPHQDTIQKVADYLLREQQISGPIHTAFTSPTAIPPIVGVDHPQHYQANVEAYRRAAGLQRLLKERLTTLEQQLAEAKRATFHPDLLAFDVHIQAYREGRIPLGPHLQFLARRHSPSLSPPPSPIQGEGVRRTSEGKQSRGKFPTSPSPTPIPAVETFLTALAIEHSLNFTQVEWERARLLETLTRSLTETQRSALLTQSLAFRLGQLGPAQFYRYLQELCTHQGISLTHSPAMAVYLRYVLLAERIDADQLFKDIDRLERTGYATLAKTPRERALVAESQWLLLVGKLLDFALTPAEWDAYKTLKPAGHPEPLGDVLRDQGAEFTDLLASLEPFERFYHEAEARNSALVTNLLAKMDDLQHSSPSPRAGEGGGEGGPRIAVLVTGGFHAPGILEQLRQANIATLTFVPKITQVDGDSGTKYLSVFAQEKTPLEQLFAGDKLFLAQDPLPTSTVHQAARLTVFRELWLHAFPVDFLNQWLQRLSQKDPRLGRWTILGFNTSGQTITGRFYGQFPSGQTTKLHETVRFTPTSGEIEGDLTHLQRRRPLGTVLSKLGDHFPELQAQKRSWPWAVVIVGLLSIPFLHVYLVSITLPVFHTSPIPDVAAWAMGMAKKKNGKGRERTDHAVSSGESPKSPAEKGEKIIELEVDDSGYLQNDLVELRCVAQEYEAGEVLGPPLRVQMPLAELDRARSQDALLAFHYATLTLRHFSDRYGLKADGKVLIGYGSKRITRIQVVLRRDEESVPAGYSAIIRIPDPSMQYTQSIALAKVGHEVAHIILGGHSLLTSWDAGRVRLNIDTKNTLFDHDEMMALWADIELRAEVARAPNPMVLQEEDVALGHQAVPLEQLTTRFDDPIREELELIRGIIGRNLLASLAAMGELARRSELQVVSRLLYDQQLLEELRKRKFVNVHEFLQLLMQVDRRLNGGKYQPLLLEVFEKRGLKLPWHLRWYRRLAAFQESIKRRFSKEPAAQRETPTKEGQQPPPSSGQAHVFFDDSVLQFLGGAWLIGVVWVGIASLILLYEKTILSAPQRWWYKGNHPHALKVTLPRVIPNRTSLLGVMAMATLLGVGLGGWVWAATLLHPGGASVVLHGFSLMDVPTVEIVAQDLGSWIGSFWLGVQQKEEGALQKGRWTPIRQHPHADLYEVEYSGKHILVIAEMHHTREANEAFRYALDQVLQNPQLFILLIEAAAKWRSLPKLLERIGAFEPLPDLLDGLSQLVTSRQVTHETMALALGIRDLHGIGKLLQMLEGQAVDKKKEIFDRVTVKMPEQVIPVKAASKTATIALSSLGIPMEQGTVEAFLRAGLETPEAVRRSVEVANHVERLAYEEADRQQAAIVRNALRTSYPRLVIHIGKGHLGSLIRSGELAQYTQAARRLEEIQVAPIQRALAQQQRSRSPHPLPTHSLDREEAARRFIDGQINRMKQSLLAVGQLLQQHAVPDELSDQIHRLAHTEMLWLEADRYARYREFNYERRAQLGIWLTPLLRTVARHMRVTAPEKSLRVLQTLLQSLDTIASHLPDAEQLHASADPKEDKPGPPTTTEAGFIPVESLFHIAGAGIFGWSLVVGVIGVGLFIWLVLTYGKLIHAALQRWGQTWGNRSVGKSPPPSARTTSEPVVRILEPVPDPRVPGTTVHRPGRRFVSVAIAALLVVGLVVSHGWTWTPEWALQGIPFVAETSQPPPHGFLKGHRYGPEGQGINLQTTLAQWVENSQQKGEKLRQQLTSFSQSPIPIPKVWIARTQERLKEAETTLQETLEWQEAFRQIEDPVEFIRARAVPPNTAQLAWVELAAQLIPQLPKDRIFFVHPDSRLAKLLGFTEQGLMIRLWRRQGESLRCCLINSTVTNSLAGLQTIIHENLHLLYWPTGGLPGLFEVQLHEDLTDYLTRSLLETAMRGRS